MQAIILAAGMGKRLKHLTADNTKCMVKVNGVTLIERMLRQLDGKGLSRIVIVTGYKGEKLKDFVIALNVMTQVSFIENPVFDRTNNIYSLSLAKEYLVKEDTLLFESDVIFEDGVIDCLLEDNRENLALVDRYESWMDGTCLRLDDEDRITDFVSGKEFDFKNTSGCFKTVNIYKFSASFSEKYYVPFMEAYLKAIGENEYYEQVLRVISLLDNKEIFAKRLNGKRWYEIDDEQDLDIAETLFDPDDDGKVIRLEERYGGYWRFPGMLDFCYLVNPYYPPDKMLDEMKASFNRLLVNYPSGLKVNQLLAAKNFGVNRENILPGNGAAEFIKFLMETFSGRTGFIRPTFEEYPNRYDTSGTVNFWPENRDFSYTSKDIISFFDDNPVDNLVLINPDNPTGNYIKSSDIRRLLEWCYNKGVRLIFDESFADFADEEDNSFIKQDILDKYDMLYIVKSISKSFGVPGLRLGVLASGDKGIIERFSKTMSIWNINSFAEFYLQIEEKYRKDYFSALQRFKTERNRVYLELGTISSIRVIPSQANYFTFELINGMSAVDFTRRLLVEGNILVKDLSEKIKSGQFVRIAIRTKEDNDRLLDVMRKVLTYA